MAAAVDGQEGRAVRTSVSEISARQRQHLIAGLLREDGFEFHYISVMFVLILACGGAGRDGKGRGGARSGEGQDGK